MASDSLTKLPDLLLKGALSLYSSSQLRSQLDDVYDAMADICSDIYQAKLDSASHAIHNAYQLSSSSDQRSELDRAITYLDEAYSLSVRLLQRTRKSGFIFVTEKPLIAEEKRVLWNLGIIDICILLYLIYRKRDGYCIIATDWHAKAVSRFREWVETYMTFTIDQLQSENPDFVEKETFTSYEMENYGSISRMEEKTDYRYVVSSKGKEYIRQQHNQMVSKFKTNLSKSLLT